MVDQGCGHRLTRLTRKVSKCTVCSPYKRMKSGKYALQCTSNAYNLRSAVYPVSRKHSTCNGHEPCRTWRHQRTHHSTCCSTACCGRFCFLRNLFAKDLRAIGKIGSAFIMKFAVKLNP